MAKNTSNRQNTSGNDVTRLGRVRRRTVLVEYEALETLRARAEQCGWVRGDRALSQHPLPWYLGKAIAMFRALPLQARRQTMLKYFPRGEAPEKRRTTVAVTEFDWELLNQIPLVEPYESISDRVRIRCGKSLWVMSAIHYWANAKSERTAA